MSNNQNNQNSNIPLDKSVAIFCHGHVKEHTKFFKIPKKSKIFTFTPYNEALYSNDDKLTKLFNNLRYCSDNDYLLDNKFFNKDHIHLWESDQFIPDMDLEFDCSVRNSEGKIEGKAHRHGIITFDDESPGLMAINDTNPEPLIHLLPSSKLREKMVAVHPTSGAEEYIYLLESLSEGSFTDDSGVKFPISLYNLISYLKIFGFEKFFVISCRTGGVDIDNLIKNKGYMRLDDDGLPERVVSTENPSQLELRRTSSFLKPNSANTYLNASELVNINQKKHPNRYKPLKSSLGGKRSLKKKINKKKSILNRKSKKA